MCSPKPGEKICRSPGEFREIFEGFYSEIRHLSDEKGLLLVWLKQNFDLVTIMTEAFGILQKMVILWQFSFKSLEKSLQSITSRFSTSARANLIKVILLRFKNGKSTLGLCPYFEFENYTRIVEIVF